MNNIAQSTKLAIPFKLFGKLNDIASEFNIEFKTGDSSLEKLIDFVSLYENKRINILFENGIHIPTIKAVNKIHKDIYVRLKGSDMTRLEELKENNIKFFFDVSMPAYNYTVLDVYLALGVSDVYIYDDLLYELDDVKRLCAAHDVNMRLVLNKIPLTLFNQDTQWTAPIWRPQDTEQLSIYFNTFEFDCGKPYDFNKLNVYYRVYFEQKRWLGQISEINEDVKFNFMNESIVPEFTEYKINCGKRCVKRLTSECHKCKQFIEIGQGLAKKGARFIIEDKK